MTRSRGIYCRVTLEKIALWYKSFASSCFLLERTREPESVRKGSEVRNIMEFIHDTMVVKC